MRKQRGTGDMPIQIRFDNLPMGFALTSGQIGESGAVASKEFISSEDGEYLIQRLEGVSNLLFSKIPHDRRPLPSTIDHLLAVIYKNKTATVFTNEVKIMANILAKRDLKAKELVLVDDVADVRAIKFEGIEIPGDAGIIYIFSAGWRKGLFYDLSPLLPDAHSTRNYDLDAALGQLYTYLMFQERLKIPADAWNALFSQGWFPFISLATPLIREMTNYAHNGWPVDDLVPKISAKVRSSLSQWQAKWSKQTLFADHADVLKTAVGRYLEADYISTISILYPRIEGLMRSYHLATRPAVHQKQSTLIQTAVSSSGSDREQMLLLPDKFRRYLEEVYFRDFDPSKPAGVSRHTVAHGVAPQKSFSEKPCLLGFLILEQLSFLFVREQAIEPLKPVA